MRQSFREAIQALLSQAISVDNEGFVNYVHQSFFQNLRMEYEAHCRKHGIRPLKKTLPKKTAA